MFISVIVPTYNRGATLDLCLQALLAQDYLEYEIILSDDGSTDDTPKVAAKFPPVKYIRGENHGPAAARNRGIGQARGEVIAFTDDDCLVPPNWLSRLADGYARHPEVAGVGGYLEPTDEALANSILARFERYESKHNHRFSDSEYVGGLDSPGGGTSNMSYYRDILQKLRGFDESFPYAAAEDADLRSRICQTGARLLFIPVKVTHLRAYSWDSFRRQYVTHGRGVVHFERKHVHLPTRLRVFLRWAKRALIFFPDLFRIGPALAWIKLWGGWLDCWGQWLEIKKLRGAS
jgi:glycosyltransferase involved in cell wall biosynthesis